MLKFIYKSVFVSVLCGSLMLMDFSYKGMSLQVQSAQAETLKTDSVKDSDMMATLTMVAVGLLTSRLYSCDMTADMMVAAAGGAAFVGGEILSTLKLKAVMKDMETDITRDSKGNINQEQIASLERLKKSYQEAVKTAKTKKMLQQAAAAAFAAAAVTAYMLKGEEETALKACQASLKAAGQSCQGLSPATSGTGGIFQSLFGTREIPKTSSAGKAAQTAGEAGAKASTTASDAAAKALVAQHTSICAASYGSSPSCGYATTCATVPATYDATCAAISPVLKSTTGFCPAPLTFAQAQSASKNLYAGHMSPQLLIMSLVLNSLSPKKAHADLFTPLGIASSAAISFLLYTNKSLGATIDTYLLAPMNRAIIWGVLAGLTYAASSATDNVIGKINANISKIDGILNNMYSMAAGATGTQGTIQTPAVQAVQRPDSSAQFNENDYEAVDLTKGDNKGALPCFTGSDAANCKSFDSGVKSLPSFASLDAASQKQILGILGAANGVNGVNKISSGTLKGMAGLASSANALKANMDSAKAKTAADLKNSGSKIDLDALSKKFSDEIEKNMKDGLKNGNTNANAMLSSMYGSKSSIGGLTGSSTDSADKKDEAAAAKKAVATAGVIDISAPATTGDSGIALTGVDAGKNKELTPEELAKLNADQKALVGKSIDDYELKNDISTDKTASLFDLISNRYQQSGYPRLFKKKEIKEDTTIPLKK